jgi:ATP-dependent NAD(P)H-hydrate dehydratase
MVSPVYSAEEFDKAATAANATGSITPNHPLVRSMVTQVTSMLDRLHALIIGPGLGRCPLVMCATAEIIRQAISLHNIPLVVDADALFLLTQAPYKDLFFLPEGVMPRTIVLTPNAIELKRLLQAINEASEGEEKGRIQQAYRGVIVVQKGQYDTVFFASSLFHNNGTIMLPEETVAENTSRLVCKEQGGLKRSGGIGDILSGSIGTFLAWDRLLTEPKCNTVITTTHDPSSATKTSRALVSLLQEKEQLVPCWVACCIVKRATKVAYDKKRRAMTAPNVLNEIGAVVDKTITSVLDTL